MIALRQIPDRMLRNFVARFEADGVQRRPCLRFVDRRGRACIVGAFADAASSREFGTTEAGRTFLEGPLLAISRAFEDGVISAADVYLECLLELARRDAESRAAGADVGEIAEAERLLPVG